MVSFVEPRRDERPFLGFENNWFGDRLGVGDQATRLEELGQLYDCSRNLPFASEKGISEIKAHKARLNKMIGKARPMVENLSKPD